ncbi:hypothetical protein JKG68_06985 [Microvirga aerilata]|jgi:hypothetical protein|uniref:Anti-sigma factor NepR domain-containing protein n=1 Tax=Microvirga aerilata TaxID=670292 RepID=A0A936ZFS9_9HYPH|nr:hypothetical protein [Microvirga aerilata]MBL0403703.1 hypothetical protein [Microvirga aerilata]
MLHRKKKTEVPSISYDARHRIAKLMRSVYFPPDMSPISEEQLDLLLALRRKERERNQST